MPADDVSDILTDLSDDMRDELLKLIKGKASVDLEQLLQHEEKTAGYIMTPNFFALLEETTAAEATERIREMAGTGAVDIGSKSIFKNTRTRLPWLLASFAGGLVAVYLIGRFEGQLKEIAALAAFIPIIMGMGGNIGTQSSTIIVRGLATGEVNLKDAWKVLWREFGTGAALGSIYGTLLGIFAMIPQWKVEAGWFPIVVALSICANMILAATVGTIIPMLFKRIRIDPAIATGPFVTTSIDIFGILSYFIIAHAFLF